MLNYFKRSYALVAIFAIVAMSVPTLSFASAGVTLSIGTPSGACEAQVLTISGTVTTEGNGQKFLLVIVDGDVVSSNKFKTVSNESWSTSYTFAPGDHTVIAELHEGNSVDSTLLASSGAQKVSICETIEAPINYSATLTGSASCLMADGTFTIEWTLAGDAVASGKPMNARTTWTSPSAPLGWPGIDISGAGSAFSAENGNIFTGDYDSAASLNAITTHSTSSVTASAITAAGKIIWNEGADDEFVKEVAQAVNMPTVPCAPEAPEADSFLKVVSLTPSAMTTTPGDTLQFDAVIEFGNGAELACIITDFYPLGNGWDEDSIIGANSPLFRSYDLVAPNATGTYFFKVFALEENCDDIKGGAGQNFFPIEETLNGSSISTEQFKTATIIVAEATNEEEGPSQEQINCEATEGTWTDGECVMSEPEDEETLAPAPKSSPKGGGFIGAGFVGGGQVLGTSTSACTPVLTSYIGLLGQTNDPEAVKTVQNFLNGELDLSLEVNGTYDTATIEAVKAFQTKYALEVLTPWGITEPTGLVFKTTQRMINMLSCPDSVFPMPVLF